MRKKSSINLKPSACEPGVPEIITKLALARMVERGLADSKAMRTISNEEMQLKIKLWLK